jgi:transposase
MFAKIEDWVDFKRQVKVICDLIMGACNKLTISDYHLISVDEKPGIQALQSKEIAIGVGKPCRRDIEYVRKGKTCLIAGTEVGTGKVVSHTFAKKNNEAEFVKFIRQTIERYGLMVKIVFLLDNLSTHSTVSLVEYIALQIGYTAPLGKNRRHGILRDQKSRRKFLTDSKHQIYFQFTPKHCSWLNPIENWFSILQRHALNGGNFESVEDLKQKINAYIKYHNAVLFKPINWQFTGFTKENPIAA